MANEKDFGLDYETAKRIIARNAGKSELQPETLAEWIREARERGLIDPDPVMREALTAVAERVLRRRRGWPIPNAPDHRG